MSYISRVFYFTETGKTWFHEISAVFNFAGGCVGLVPRRTESNFGYRLAKYAELNPP